MSAMSGRGFRKPNNGITRSKQAARSVATAPKPLRRVGRRAAPHSGAAPSSGDSQQGTRTEAPRSSQTHNPGVSQTRSPGRGNRPAHEPARRSPCRSASSNRGSLSSCCQRLHNRKRNGHRAATLPCYRRCVAGRQRSMQTRNRTASVAIATCLLGTAAGAQTPPYPPPPEAYGACSSKAAGEACSVTTPDKLVLPGVCFADRDQKLFCMPEWAHGAPRGPPPGLLDACSGKKAGDTCSATLADGSARSGTCNADPRSQLACLPNPN